MSLELTMAPDMAARTSLGLGGAALAEATARDESGLLALAETLQRLGGAPLALGRGTNLLARDGELDLVLVRAGAAGPPEVLDEQASSVLVKTGASMGLPGLLGWLAGHGLSGLEGLCGVPGSVGGAVAMNAGSYGREMRDALESVRLFSLERGTLSRTADEVEAGYRFFNPGVEGFYLLWEVVLRLERDRPEAIRARMREVYGKKKTTQPVTCRTAGCVYKNPPGDSAGRLLDQAGMRGQRLGGVGFSERHANFLVNYGGGSSREALEIMEQAEELVLRKFGIELEREVQVI